MKNNLPQYVRKYSLVALISCGALSLTACFDSDSDDIVDVNSPPVAGDVSLITQTETAFTQDIPATDPDGDTLSVEIVETAKLGTVVLDSSGSFTYTPDPEVTGVDSFIYSVTDGNSASVTGMVEITIEALEVSFRAQSRLAFGQEANDTAISVNGRNFIQDVSDQNDYQDLIDGNNGN